VAPRSSARLTRLAKAACPVSGFLNQPCICSRTAGSNRGLPRARGKSHPTRLTT
jgi:hypothetical protein